MYLFDTDTITNILKKRPSQNLVRKLENLDKSCQFISTITIDLTLITGNTKHLERISELKIDNWL